MQVRIDGVDPATQRLLACAAVLGEPWEPQELVALAGVTPDAPADGLTAAQKADLVEPLGLAMNWRVPITMAPYDPDDPYDPYDPRLPPDPPEPESPVEPLP